MPKLIVTDRDGMPTAIEGAPLWYGNLSRCRLRRAAGCWRFAADAAHARQCHIYARPAHADALPPMGADENDLLESSDHLLPTSRLLCQLAFAASLDGLEVRIAPED